MSLKLIKKKKDTCFPLFIAALFTIARTWKQPKCLSTDEWIKKLWYIYTMEYYSAIKRNTFESVLMSWMNLEPIIQNEVSQKVKDKYCILMRIFRIEKWYWRIYLQGSNGETAIENRLMDMRGEERVRCMERVTWKLALPYVKYPTRICCLAQEIQTGALYQPRGVGWGGRWEGGSQGRRDMYTYGWFMLRFDRKQQNSVKQLLFN